MANIFDQFDEEEPTSTEPNIFDQFDKEEPTSEEPTINPELVAYVSQPHIQGNYVAADLEAAGFTNEEISAFEATTLADADGAKPRGDGSRVYPGVPSGDTYDGYALGGRGDTLKNKEPDAEVTAFQIYNAYADNENTVVDSTGNLIYNDPVGGKSWKVYYPRASGTAIPVISDLYDDAVNALAPGYQVKRDAGVNEGTFLLNQIADSVTNTIEVVAALGDMAANKVGMDTKLLEWSNEIHVPHQDFLKLMLLRGKD